MNTDIPRNRTLADLPDQTQKPREQLAQSQALLATHERRVADLNAHLEAARANVQAAEADTARLEAAVRTAGDRQRGQCAADYGVSVLRLADLRKSLAAAQTRHAAELPQATSDLESTRGYIQACEAAILTAQFRNALALYQARIADANLIALGNHVIECAARARVEIGANWNERPGLLCDATPTKLGRFTEVHLKKTYENFQAALAPKPTPPPEPLRVPPLATATS